MAQARKLKSGSWRCLVYDYTDSAGKRHYKSFTNDDPSPKGKRLAELAAAEYAAGKRELKSVNNITFGDALDKYIAMREPVLSPASIKKYKKMRNSSAPKLMAYKIADISQDVIQSVINEESKTHSPKSVRDLHGLISAVMRAERPDLRLNTILPKRVRPDIYVPSDAEIQRLTAYSKDKEILIPIMLAAYCGMRRGEISALQGEDIKGNMIHVHQTMVETSEHTWQIKAPKSYAGDRFVPAPAFVIELLPKKGNVTPLNPTMISQRFSRVLKGCKLPEFRFHDLRHYYASTLHALGVPDQYIMERCGWGNDAVLKDVYRHTLGDVKEKMNDLSNAYFENMQHEMQHAKKEP